MCGIAGCYGFGDRATLRRMTGALAHRGPDGEYLYADGPVLLGNRRLAIQDVEHGRQPMTNADGSVVVVYNGEIYNYPELRAELIAAGCPLKTRCDTEVIPYLYERDGIGFARRLNGIFAIALWDRREGALHLIRDPLGVKPLLYAQDGGRLAFGSEAKAILASGLCGAALDPVALHYTMNVRYVPGTRTLFSGISRVRPGHVLTVHGGAVEERPYFALDWTPDESLSEDDWTDGVRHHLEAAVNRQLLSDVPVGVSLSGGIDSSALVAMIRRRFGGELRTFTLGFDEPTDENDDARFVAERFATTHEDLVLREPAMAHLREAIYYTEEPKVNCLQLFLLHRFVGRHVKVVLSGLGGDELFGGYDFYAYLFRSEAWARRLPAGLHAALFAPVLDGAARGLTELGRPHLDLFVRGLEWIAGLHDGARHYLTLRNAWDFNRALLRRVYHPDAVAAMAARVRREFDPYFLDHEPTSVGAMKAEFGTKMVNDLLHNEDTMSMAHSLESRVPWLDLEFVAFAARIPPAIRFRGGMKGLLKRALSGVIPDEVIAKKKWGFTVNPVEQFHKDLKPLAESILGSERFAKRRIFNPAFVRAVLDARPHPRLRWHYFMLWQMIGFEHWCEIFLDGDPVEAGL